LLLAVGFDERKAGGSHSTFRFQKWRLVIPRQSPVNRVYVDRAIKACKEILIHD